MRPRVRPRVYIHTYTHYRASIYTLENRTGYRRHVAVLLEVVEIFIICHQSYCVVTLLLLDLRRTERAALTAHCNANGTALIYLALEGRLLNELYHVPL
jgi:hypothetical protein